MPPQYKLTDTLGFHFGHFPDPPLCTSLDTFCCGVQSPLYTDCFLLYSCGDEESGININLDSCTINQTNGAFTQGK